MASTLYRLGKAPELTTKRLKEPIHLLLDWDKTLTTTDTMHMFGLLPAARDERLHREAQAGNKKRKGPPGGIRRASTCPNDYSSAPSPGTFDFMSTDMFVSQVATPRRASAPLPEVVVEAKDYSAVWESFGAAWMTDYNQLQSRSHIHKAAHKCSHDSYTAWLKSLSTVEYASAHRVQTSDFLKGLKTEDIATTVSSCLDNGSLQLQPGWKECLELFALDDYLLPGSKLSIISVNWSATLIRWSLYLAASRAYVPGYKRSRVLQYINDMDISANLLPGLDAPLGCSGKIDGSIRTAHEKRAAMPVTKGIESPREAPFVVYVGDSSTDYLCLRHADAGIWLSDVSPEPPSAHREAFAETFHPLDTDRELTVFPLVATASDHDDGNGGQANITLQELVDDSEGKKVGWVFDLKQVADALVQFQFVEGMMAGFEEGIEWVEKEEGNAYSTDGTENFGTFVGNGLEFGGVGGA